MIYAVDALRVVLGELNEHRKARIDDTFDSLLLEAGASVDSTLDFTTVIRRFRAEAHPDVVSGTKNHQEVLAYLMEAFEGTSDSLLICEVIRFLCVVARRAWESVDYAERYPTCSRRKSRQNAAPGMIETSG